MTRVAIIGAGIGGLAAALADVGLALVEAREELARGDAVAAWAAAARFNAPIAAPARATQRLRARGERL